MSATTMDTNRLILNRESADKLMAPGEYVHTFMQAAAPTLVLIGADRKREEILALADVGKVELAGPAATRMRHGLVAETQHGHVFVATA